MTVEHDVSESKIHGPDGGELIEEILSNVSKRPHGWGFELAQIVGTAFRCKMYVTKEAWEHFYRPAFLGHRADAAAANLVYERLYTYCDREAKRVGDIARKTWRQEARKVNYSDWFIKREGNKAAKRARESFANGFYEGVRIELEKQSVALLVVVPKDVEAEYAKMKICTSCYRLGSSERSDEYAHGFNAGRDAVRAGRIGESNAYALNA